MRTSRAFTHTGSLAVALVLWLVASLDVAHAADQVEITYDLSDSQVHFVFGSVSNGQDPDTGTISGSMKVRYTSDSSSAMPILHGQATLLTLNLTASHIALPAQTQGLGKYLTGTLRWQLSAPLAGSFTVGDVLNGLAGRFLMTGRVNCPLSGLSSYYRAFLCRYYLGLAPYPTTISSRHTALLHLAGSAGPYGGARSTRHVLAGGLQSASWPDVLPLTDVSLVGREVLREAEGHEPKVFGAWEPPASESALGLEWVSIGDPGNEADETGFGAVADIYWISKYEVTNAQYVEFLNAVAASDPNGLYNTDMATSGGFDGFSGLGGITRSGSPGSFTYTAIAGRESMPVNYVSFYDALRFANWLHNGRPVGPQGNATTEDGAYTITAAGIADYSITRNPEAKVFLASEDEWYKAAYYDASSRSYFEYPTRSNAQTVCAAPGATANTANCMMKVGDLTDVGSYTNSTSQNGTFDQGGNVAEWTEASRVRGGALDRGASYMAASSVGIYVDAAKEGPVMGFRVASVPDPAHNEPPVADAGPDQTSRRGALVTLDGSSSFDADGDVPLTFDWALISVPEGSTAVLANADSAMPEFTPDRVGDYKARLVVTDATGLASAPDEVTVSTYNTAPFADAGGDIALIEIGTRVTLDGSGSDDLDGDPITFLWSLDQKPAGSTAELDDRTSPTPSFVADVRDPATPYVASLVVTDSLGASSPVPPDEDGSVTISFDNLEPTAQVEGPGTATVNSAVILDGSGSSDPNLDRLTYAWSLDDQPAGSTAVLRDASSDGSGAQVSVVPDVSGSYTVSLKVHDGDLGSVPATHVVVATTLLDQVMDFVEDSDEALASIDAEVFTNKNSRKTLQNKVGSVADELDGFELQDALDKLEHDLLPKTDGCALRGSPDSGGKSGHPKDWIQACGSGGQRGVYDALRGAADRTRVLLNEEGGA